MSMIKQTDATQLNVDELRQLVKWCDDQTESWWNGAGESGADYIGLAAILAIYHVCNDHDYYSLDGWYSDDSDAAVNAWENAIGQSASER